jgi:pimeloyl-ACP methyl ester carboxylesterase
MPERVISIHMLATAATKPDGKQCKIPLESLANAVKSDVQNPQKWWAFPANSPTHRIPGYADRAFEEGARTFFIRGQMGDPTPEAAEMQRYCGPAPDVSKVTAPVYIYQGGDDPLVTLDQANYWKTHYPKVAAFNVYPGEAHDVQYRHWDQVLIELAGFAGKTVVCESGHSKVIPAAAVKPGTQLGICAWATK